MDKFVTTKKMNYVTVGQAPAQQSQLQAIEEFEESLATIDSQQAQLWFEKYRPQTIDQVVVSQVKLDQIKQWFADFEKRTVEMKALLFTGPPGLGKTSLAHAVLASFGYRVIEFNASDIRSQSLVNKSMHDIMCVNNINNDLPTAVIMDEVDGMLSGDRGGIEEMLSFLQPNKTRKTRKTTKTKSKTGLNPTGVWGPPVICICNTANIKQAVMTSLRKHCKEISFVKPTRDQLLHVVDRVVQGEGLKIDKATRDEVVKFGHQDYRRLLCLLQHLTVRYGQEFTVQDVHRSYQIFCQKEQDLHVTDDVKRVLNRQLDYNDTMNVYYRNKSKTPMVIHRNYVKAVEFQKTSALMKLDNAIRIMDSIVDSDIVEKTIFNRQGWHFQPIQGVLCCYVPSYFINTFPKSRTVDAVWTEVVGTNNQLQSSKKKVREINVIGNSNYSHTTIQFLSELVVSLLIKKRESEALDLLEQYNLLESKIIDKLSSVVKAPSLSSAWKTKSTSEKNRFDAQIQTRLQRNTAPIVQKLKPGTMSNPTKKAKLTLKGTTKKLPTLILRATQSALPKVPQGALPKVPQGTLPTLKMKALPTLKLKASAPKEPPAQAAPTLKLKPIQIPAPVIKRRIMLKK